MIIPSRPTPDPRFPEVECAPGGSTSVLLPELQAIAASLIILTRTGIINVTPEGPQNTELMWHPGAEQHQQHLFKEQSSPHPGQNPG